jgi:hypothetical protein
MITYDIEGQKNLVRTKIEGTLTLQDLRVHMESVLADPRYHQGMNTIVDLNDARLDIAMRNMPLLARFLRSQEAVRRKGRWAVVQKQSTVKLILDLAIATIPLKTISLKAFDDERPVIQWLEKDRP